MVTGNYVPDNSSDNSVEEQWEAEESLDSDLAMEPELDEKSENVQLLIDDPDLDTLTDVVTWY